MSAPRAALKRWLARTLVGSGGWNAALARWARRDTAVVLTYHRILDKWEPRLDYSQPGMVVTVATFERQLSMLARHFQIVSLGDVLEEGPLGTAGRPRCAITFDDGWRDNYELALPLLRKYRLPATIFLTTDFIDTERVFWHTELMYVILHGDLSLSLRDAAFLRSYAPSVRTALERCTVAKRTAADLDACIEIVKAACDETVIASLIDTLARAAGLTRPFFPGRRFFLDWSQVREMASNGFDIGSHGCSHRIMTRLTQAQATDEMVASRREIEGRIGCPVVHFAFPNEDADEALVHLAARAGYRSACTAAIGSIGPSIRTVRRAGMHEGTAGGGPAYDDALLSLFLLRAPKNDRRPSPFGGRHGGGPA